MAQPFRETQRHKKNMSTWNAIKYKMKGSDQVIAEVNADKCSIGVWGPICEIELV